jgi:D-glucosaminate-6-phosphate ammonia-lyase
MWQSTTKMNAYNVYEDLGIEPFVNAYRPLTRLGGAIMPEVVVEAMRGAARKSVDLKTLQQKVGKAISVLTQNEAAYVSCGAASGITLAIAACMAGTDAVLSGRLPNTEGMKNEVIMHACDRGFKCDVAIRCAGARIVNIGNEDGASEGELRSAINSGTAAIFSVVRDCPGKIPLEQMILTGQEYSVPVLVDAAFLVPPKENLWKYTRDAGADAAIFSGGKGLRGPQSTGLVLGKAWIVEGCAFQGVPNDRIGRGMKVGKEELAGIYAAVKLFMEQDDATILAERIRQLDYILACIDGVTNVTFRRTGNIMAVINFDNARFGLTYKSAWRWLLDTAPSVYLESSKDGLIVSTECMEAGDEEIVGSKLRELFESGPNKV